LSADACGATVPERNFPVDGVSVPGKESPMRTKRIMRSLVIAGTAAALSILSIVSTVMAVTGGGDFPRVR
jgi:hypothetical protein